MAVPPPTTEIAVANLALARIGQKSITNLEGDDLSWIEELCALHFPMTRRRLLRGPRIYNFAKERVQLTLDALVTPAFGFSSAFKLPNNHLRVLALGDIDNSDPTFSDLYDLRGRHIFTDELESDSTINLSYIKDETNVAIWDAIFSNLMRLELAKDMGYAFTLKQSLVEGLDQELKDVRLEAGAVAGQEQPPRRVSRSKWVRNRQLGGGRDTTRHSI